MHTLFKILSSIAFSFLFFGGIALAAVNPFTIQFPIPELGNCGSLSECKIYCDDSANASACIAWAGSHGLVAKNNSSAQATSTAQTKILNALKTGPGPGGCTALDQCKLYCSDASHHDECLLYAKTHSLLTKNQQAQDARAAELDALLQAGGGPGGCTTKDACYEYCNDPTHREECVAFAKKAGLVSDAEASTITNLPKTGPGGCTSPDACAQFCNDPANEDTCVSFAEEHGIVKPGDGGALKQGISLVKELSSAPPQILSCISMTFSPEVLSGLKSGAAPSPDVLAQIRQCVFPVGEGTSTAPGIERAEWLSHSMGTTTRGYLPPKPEYSSSTEPYGAHPPVYPNSTGGYLPPAGQQTPPPIPPSLPPQGITPPTGTTNTGTQGLNTSGSGTSFAAAIASSVVHALASFFHF